MSFKKAEVVLAAAVATNGTFTVNYPEGTDSGTFVGTHAHKMWAAGLQAMLSAPSGFTVSFGASNITVTYKGTTSIPAGTRVNLQFDTLGAASWPAVIGNGKRMSPLTGVVLNLGAPDTIVTDFFVKAATSTELPASAGTTTYTADTSGTSPLDGTAPVVTKNGVKYLELDVPRNLVSTATHGSSVVAMTITIVGLDEYGVAMSEAHAITATGTTKTANGKKAFKWVRSIAFTVAADATANTVNIGFGDVIGLPIALPEVQMVAKEAQDGAAPTAGTLVKADRSAATTTTGDVRGTYDPNAACDGAKAFELFALVPEPNDMGVTQA